MPKKKSSGKKKTGKSSSNSKIHWSLRFVWWIIKRIFKLLFLCLKYIFIGCKHLYYNIKEWHHKHKEKKEEERLASIQEDIEKGALKNQKKGSNSKKTEMNIVEENSFSKPRKTASYEEFKNIYSLKGNWKHFEEKLVTSSSLIGIILGARGSGKTGVGLRLLENIYSKTKRKCFAIGFKDLPKWITVVEKIEDIENNAVVLVDEGGILFSSRQSMSESNKVLTELILIARHKDLSIIFISQNSANIEINAIRQADYLLLKPSSLLQRDFERKKIKEIYDEVKDEFKKYKNIKGLTYVYSESFRGFVSNPLPGFWSTKVSKGFREKV